MRFNFALPFIFCLFFILPVVANQHYQNNIHYAKDAGSLRSKENFNARDYCKEGDTACVRGIAHPKEQSLNADKLKQKALVQKESDDMASAVSSAFINQPDIDLNTSQDLQRAVQVMENSYEITHGISNRYTDCKTPNQSCKPKSIEKTCRKSHEKQFTCETYPEVTGFHTQKGTTYLGRSDSWFSQYTINLPEKGLYVEQVNMTTACSSSSHIYKFQQAYLKRMTGRNSLNVQLKTKKAKLPVQTLVKGKTLTLYFSHAIHLADFEIVWEKRIPDIATRNTCARIPQSCYIQTKKCIEPEQEKEIQGTLVKQVCWRTQIEYQCGQADVDTCDALSDCELLTQNCVDDENGFCLTHEQKRRCIVQQCETNHMICGEQSFCLDGECDTDAKERNQDEQTQDFQKSASALAAMNSAGKSLKDARVNPTMFQGKGMKCGGDALAFSKCCKDSGWGLSLGISDCSEEEKKLGKAKEKGLAVYLGKYCSTRVLGVCIKHKKGYCVFENKMAYIIQTQGRRGQLNISMGSGKHPDCRGITPEEMQGLDFSKVDFSSFYSELNHKTPDPQVLQNKMARKLRSKT